MSVRAPRGGLTTLAVTAALAACGPAGEIVAPASVDGEALRTDATAYRAVYRGGAGAGVTYGFRVVATFTNPLPVAVYLARCYPDSPRPTFGIELVGDTAGAGGWGSAFSRAWACVGHDRQFVVAPGATRVDTLDVAGPNAWQGGAPRGRFDGRVRVVYGVSTCPGDGGCPGAGELGASNAFDVVVAR